MPGTRPQRLAQQRAIRQLAVEQHRARRWHFLIKLTQKSGQHFLLRHIVGVRGEKAAMPPILAAANEKRLHPDHAIAVGHRKHIGVADTIGVDRL